MKYAIAAIPLLFFLVVLAATPRHQLVPKSDVKPDLVYSQSAAPGAASPAATPDQSIIYFAPISSTLPVLLSGPSPVDTAGGTVRMLVKIDVAGNVRDPNIIRGLGPGPDDQALRAVINWRFRPAQLDGKPIGASAVLEVPFRQR